MSSIIMAALAASFLAPVSQQPSYRYDMERKVFILAADQGGDVQEYAKHFFAIEQQGMPVHIMGDCLSACTMVLQNKKACAMPNARFGFHMARTYNKITLEVQDTPSDLGNKVLWAHYPIHVRTRLGTLPWNMVYVPATDFIPPCEKSRARQDVETAGRFRIDYPRMLQ